MASDFERLYVKEFSPGTVLFTEGEEGSEMYIVRKGSVKLSRRIGGREYILSIIEDGGFFGEMALLLGRPRTATATVMRSSSLLILNKAAFQQMIQRNADIALKIMETLARRLLRANRQIETLLLEDRTYRVVLALHHHAQEEGKKMARGTFVPMTLQQLANFTGLSIGEASEILDKLAGAHLLVPQGDGILITEDENYLEFLEFLEMKEKTSAS